MDIFRKAYRELNPDEVQAMNEIKSEADKLYTMMVELKFTAYEGVQPPETGIPGPTTMRDFTVTADPRCMAMAKTKLEEAVMWATKAITG